MLHWILRALADPALNLQGLETKQEELATLKRELDGKTSELNEIRGIEIEMRNKLEENQKILGDNQKRLRYWNEKLGKLKIHSVR